MAMVPLNAAQVRRQNRRRRHLSLRMLAGMLVCTAIVGCGQKGPLYQPQTEAASTVAPVQTGDDAASANDYKDTVEGRDDDASDTTGN